MVSVIYLKERKMKQQKLRASMLLMELMFLLIVVGGSVLLYNMFAPAYYRQQKSRVIEKAYEEVKRMDLSAIGDEEMETLKSYEGQNLTFTIANKEMDPVYTTGSSQDNLYQDERQVHRNIVVYRKFFEKDPKVQFWNARGKETLWLFGRLKQGDERYFVCVKENVQKVYSALFYTEKFLLFVVVFSLLSGCAFMYWQSRRIAKPIEELSGVSQKLTERDFSVRAKNYGTYQEISVLAHNFNMMADDMQDYIQKLESSKDALERFNKMRNDFTANITHELKTPLAVISGQIELLQAMGDKVDQDYYFSSIREEVQKMSDMVGNLLNISSMEHELENVEKQRLNLSETVEYMMLKYDALFHKKNLKIASEIEKDCRILGNREYIEQAAGNYIMNAFAHCGEGRHMKISLAKKDGKAVFGVYNDSEPLTDEEKRKIWEKYYQGEEQTGHSGLGLYIVKTVITMHGGTYGVDNRENGVCFWFSLPLV